MRIPVIRGVIDRRVLVNFRVDPTIVANILPSPFRPQLIHGYAIAGICLIRLKQTRMRFMPAMCGLTSENAAHRIAVEWDVDGVRRTGVYVPRRDTSSRLNAIVGGRVFPGTHHHARFDVQENDDEFRIAMDSHDRQVSVGVDARLALELPETSIFDSLTEVSEFFEQGSLGYSPNAEDNQFDGLELQARNWHVEPLTVTNVESSYFDDPSIFPAGSVLFDNALLMRRIDHEWHERSTICAELQS